MIGNPCLLIPIYNHKDSIASTVDRLLPYGLPIFIVDDGSNAATKTVLGALAERQPLVRLFSLPENAGKGAAVMHGMLMAERAGFTHALQIDADGQHDTADVGRFLAQSAAHPDAIICGQPIYDSSVPKGRLYGRYLTHVWVWIETLSFAIADSMCGFRLYPLAATCALIKQVAIPTRMDFDIEIIVRLAWAGLPIENIKTRVIYPENGISHFDMWRDNVRISKMHTRLFFAMLPRLPLLLWRRLAGHPGRQQHWSRLAERGSGLGMRIVFACYRLLGERAARLLLYPIVAYFFLTSARARHASHDYLSRLARRSGGTQPGWRDSYKHMLAFAQSGLDKVTTWMGGIKHRPIDFPNRASFDAQLASGQGAVLIGSHLGNLEMTRALAADQQIAGIHAVVSTEHARQFNRLLAAASANFSANLLEVSRLGPETAIMLRDKIDQGEFLVIVGDRTSPSENGRISVVDFLGTPAPFAQGPFILASLLECPVYLFFCLREADGYRIHFEHFADRIELPRQERQERLQGYLEHYAQRLESYCQRAPNQWFNFYDFWRQEAVTTPNRTASPATKA